MNEIILDKKVEWLKKSISRKMEKNPKFSLRAYAQKVDISPAVISRILNGKRKLTFNLAMRIADNLNLSNGERDELLDLYNPLLNEKDESFDLHSKELTIECFTAMKDWYHYGITQLLNIDGFVEDHKLIARMLKISELEVKFAIQRLINLEILDRDEFGKLYRTSSHFTTTTDIASSGLRHFQKQILEKAIVSLESDSLDERDITSITVAIDESKLKEAKQEIKKFRLKMAEFLSNGERSRVYNLGIHLIPISKSINECLSNKGESYEMDH